MPRVLTKIDKIMVRGYSTEDVEDKCRNYPMHDIVAAGGDRGELMWAILRKYVYEDQPEEEI